MLTSELTQEYALSLFEYRDGKIYWKIRRPRVTIGKEAGCIKAKGYKYVCIDGVQYRVHRVIYLMHHGECPELIDHDDNNPLNNKIENLKPLTNSENLTKIPIRITKVKDVWRLCLTKHYGHKLLGEYTSLELATEAKKFYKSSLGI